MAVDWDKVPSPTERVNWDKVPPPPTQKPVEQTAYQSAGVDQSSALTALDLSQKTGLSPTWVRDNYAKVKADHEGAQFEQDLAAHPDIKAWADQSPEHAAAVRPDMGALGRIANWLSWSGLSAKMGGVVGGLQQGVVDIAEAEAMREYMGSGGPAADAATGLEEAQKLYDSRDHSYPETIARAVPQIAAYGAVTVLTGGVGLAALLYAQNKGVLARRIQLAQSDPPETGAIPLREGQTAEDKSLTADQIDNWASAGSAVAAVTLAGLLGPLVRSIPGAKEGLASLSAGVLTRAAATSVGKAAIRELGAYGLHVLMGASGMALQGVINEATVQKATSGKVDMDELKATGTRDFVNALPIVLTFGAWGPARDFLKERGRINEALASGATLDDLVRHAKESKLRQQSPPLAEELFGLLGRGGRVFIDWRAARSLDLPPEDVARASATQGSVAVPVAKYLAKFADEHEAIREDMKTNPEGYTPKEASEKVKEIASAMSVEDARALYGKMPGEGGFSYPLAGELTREQLAKGYGLKTEEIDAALGPQTKTTPGLPSNTPAQTVQSKPLHEVMAELYGGTPEEWAKRLTPELLERLTAPTRVSSKAAEMAEVALQQKTLGDINPAQFERDARKASDAYAKQAVKSGDLAAKPGQESKAVVSRAKEAELAQVKETARAFAGAAAKTREKYDAALSKLQGRGADGSAWREVFHAADAESGGAGYDNVFRGLIDAISGAALPRPEALDSLGTVLERMRQRNSSIAFDPAVVQQLLSRGKAWDEMTPAEADHVLVAVKNLREAAKREVQIGKERLADAAANVTWEAASLPKVNEPLVPGNAPWWQRVARYGSAFNARTLERMDILKSLGATVKRLVVDGYYKAAEKEDQLSRTIGEKYTEALRDLPKEMQDKRFDNVQMPQALAEAYQKRGLAPNPDRKFLWTAALMWGDGQARQRYVSGLGVDHDMVNNWLVDNMTKTEWEFVKKVGGLESGQLWAELKAKEERKSGVAPEQSKPAPIFDRDGNKIADGWYFPLARDRRAYLTDGGAQLADGPKSPGDLFGPNYQRPAVSHRFVKERAQQAAYVVDLNWDRIPHHISQVIHDIAFDEFVTDSSKLLLHPEVDKTMKERIGMEKRDQVHAWLYVAANERAEAAQGLGKFQSVFSFLRNRTQSAGLGNSVPVLAAIATHSLFSLFNGEVRLSGAIDYAKAVSPSVRQWAVETFEAVRQRQTSGKRQLQEDMGLLSDRLRDSYVGKGLELAARVAQFGQDFMDHTLAVGLAAAKYNEVFEKTHDHDAAVAAGNDMVRNNLQPREPAEKSMLMNDKGALSAILIFHGFFNKVYGKAAEFTGAASNAWANLPEKPVGTDEWAQKQQEEYSKQRNAAAWKTAEASGKFLALATVLGLGKLALGHGREEGENWGQWYVRTALGALFDLIPFASNVTQPILDKVISGKTRPVDFRAAPAFAGVQKMIRSVQDAANENKSDRMWKAADAVIMAAGAGSSQYTRTLKYVTGPKGQRDFDYGRIGEYIHGVGYGEQNKSETFPRLVEHLIEGTK